MRHLYAHFLCVALGAVLLPLPGIAQSARPLGQTVPVFSPVGDIEVRVAPPSETRVNIQAEPEGGFFARRRVLLRMLRAGSDGHLVSVDVGTSSVQVPGIQGLHEVPLSDRGEFTDTDGAASVLSLHPDRGDMVRVDLVVLIPAGHSVELHWAAGSVTVEGRSETWTSTGSPRNIRITNDGRELRVDG